MLLLVQLYPMNLLYLSFLMYHLNLLYLSFRLYQKTLMFLMFLMFLAHRHPMLLLPNQTVVNQM